MPRTTSPSEEERAALLAFEQLFEAWRAAGERAMEAQLALWREVLQPTGAQRRRELAAEAARLREEALRLYEEVLSVHRRGVG